MKFFFAALFVGLGLTLGSAAPAHAAINPNMLAWWVQYLIDQSQTVNGKNQATSPRDNRGLALSPDGAFLYAGYNSGSASPGHPKQIRKIDLSKSDYTDATVAILENNRGKTLATDDKGRVYMAEGSDTDTLDGPGIHIYNANLTTKLFSLGTGILYGLTKPEGVAVTRESGALVLYATDRTTDSLYRFVLTEGVGDAIIGASMSGLDGNDGVMSIIGSSDMRGVEVDPSGKIWMADIGSDLVFRVNSDGTGLVSTSVTDAFDIAFDDSQAFVTQYAQRTITTLKQNNLSSVATIAPLWNALRLDPTGDSGGALSGIVIKSGSQIFVTNENGQTENEQSTYGRCDANSDNPGGPCVITDQFVDDNEPILRAQVPTALTLAAFEARAQKQAIALHWDTASEINLIGFHVWRAQVKRARRKLTPEMIPAKNIGQINGAVYVWRDRKLKRGKTYTYQIELLYAGGASEWSEPQRVTFK